jgi:hypothetical protein
VDPAAVEANQKGASTFQLEFPFTHHRIALEVFPGARPTLPNEHKRWFRLAAVDKLPIPNPHRRALARLLPGRWLISPL